MEQKPESTVSLYELLLYLRNFFPGERWACIDEPIRSGSVELPGLEEGDYYLVQMSKRNDGLHVCGENDLVGDTLTGYVTECRIPAALLAIHEEINHWQSKNGDAAASPFTSESFGGYSYSKGSTNNAGGIVTWQGAFSGRLNTWRKL